MPGNEVGDRVHNFFDQGSLSRDQRHTQLVEAEWPAFNNNPWGANERQIGGPLNSSSKNYSAAQSDIERGQNNQFSLSSHGLNFTQSNLRPEFGKSPSQLQQLNLNGFMHSPQVAQTRQNEANFMGVNTESDRHNVTSRGLSFLESQQRSASQQSNSANFGGSEVPMNFNFFGSQQQMSGQQTGLLRQQSPVSEAQLLQQQQQQQVMLNQMQELQRRQQFQQFEAMQRSAMSHMSNFPNQMGGQHVPALNGNPMHDASNFPWQSQVMAGNTNWQQGGHPSAMHGYSNGLMITPEQGQAMRYMGLVPQQASQSLYGVPVSNSRGANPFSQNSVDKPGMLHAPAPSSSFSGAQYVPQTEQVSIQDGNTLSRSGSEGKNSFQHASSQGLGNVVNLGGFNQMQQRNVPMAEGSGQGFPGGSDLLPEKSASQASAPQATSSQVPVGLDPTEEKILFGNDVNIWEAFGPPTVVGSGGCNRLDGPDLFNGFASVQSGTWSALMQSAVAETSSSDGGMQEEFSGLGSQHSRSQSGNQHPPAFQDNEKPPPVWVDSSQRASTGSRATNNDGSTNVATSNANYLHGSRLQQPYSNQSSLQSESQILQEERRWLDSNQPKPHAGEKRMLENSNSFRDSLKSDTGFWSHQQSMFLSESVSNSKMRVSHGIVKDDAAAPSFGNLNVSHESSQRPTDNHSLDLWKSINSSANSGSDGTGKDQHNLNKGHSVLESSVNVPDGRLAEMHGTENGDVRENSNDSHRSNFSHHPSAGGFRENVWSDTGDGHSLPGGQEMSSGQAGRRVPVPRKFQYHPMGDVRMDESPYVAKQVSHLQSMSHHFSPSPKGLEAQPKSLGPAGMNSADMEKVKSGFLVQGSDLFSIPARAVNMSHGIPSSSVRPGYLPSTSACFVGSGEIPFPNQRVSQSQNMLELLHKVDQSKEPNSVSHLASTDYNVLSDIQSGGNAALGHSQSFTSHGFNLQLAPPSQAVASSNLSDAAQSSLKTADSPSSGHLASENGDKAHAWLSSVSAQCIPPQSRPPQTESGNEKSGSLGNAKADGIPNMMGHISASLTSGSYMRNPFQNQHMTAPGGQLISDPSATVSTDRHAFHGQQRTESQIQAMSSQSVSNSHNDSASERAMNQSGVRASARQIPPSLHAGMAGVSTKDNLSPLGPNLWTSQQQILGAQARNASNLMKSPFQSNVTSPLIQQKKDEQDSPRTEDASSSYGIVVGEEPPAAESRSMGKTLGTSQEEEPSVRQSMDASPSNSAASQKDIDASHHSLKINNLAHHRYALLQQMQAMQNMGMDPSYRESKRLKGPDNGPDGQPMAGKAAEPYTGGMNNLVRDPLMSRIAVSAGDAKMLNFSPQSGNRNTSFQFPQGTHTFPQGTVTSQDMLSFSRSDPQKFATGNVTSRSELTGISPQMAPSWFQQYGTFKNGQLSPVPNMPRVPMAKNLEHQFVSGKLPNNMVVQNSAQLANAVTDIDQIGNTIQTTNAYTQSEHVSTPHALVPHVSTPSPASIRPKKRKTATSDLLPWSKEIGQGIKRLLNMSSAEVDWSQSSNRLLERVEDELDTREDLLPMIRPRRRLILTTQLMQQMFRPPSASVLSLDARSKYEVVLYSIARLALGDACSLNHSKESEAAVDCGNPLSGKVKTSERIRDQYFSKVMDDFIKRSKEMENDLLRLDKRASILDFRLDCQDLERFSVINRFARFHGRSQVDGAETSSSCDATAMSQKPCPQRFVSAHPMPRTVPDRVQCLSL